jgi:hypothetical protein
MIGFNHAAAGAIISKLLPLPLAIPTAFLSHFILDAMPHYGIPYRQRDKVRLWKIVFITDFFATLGMGLFLFEEKHYAMLICAFTAVCPDFIWVVRVIKKHSFNLGKHKSWFARFHARIQQFERPWGIYIELPLAVVMFYFAYIQK